jgi:hypothetical protein
MLERSRMRRLRVGRVRNRVTGGWSFGIRAERSDERFADSGLELATANGPGMMANDQLPAVVVFDDGDARIGRRN